MSNQEVLEFKLERKERPLTIDGESYVLQELDGKERDRYLNSLVGRMRTDDKGKPGSIKNFEGLQGTLIAASLRKIEPEGRIHVKLETIQSWPSSLVRRLFDVAKEISSIEEDQDDEKEGND